MKKIDGGVTICSNTDRYLTGEVPCPGDNVELLPHVLESFTRLYGHELPTNQGWVQKIEKNHVSVNVQGYHIACDADSLKKLS